MIKEVTHLKYFNEYFKDCSYKDAFGWNGNWNKEIDKWLENVHELDKEYYNIGKNRVKKDSGRDGFLAEICTIFYFQKYLNFTNIEIEPNKNTLEDVDFCANDEDGVKWNIEVKTASWKKQIIKNPKKPTSQELKRIKDVQHKNSDGGFFASKDVLEYALNTPIKKALKKFQKANNNMLVVVPNLKLPIIDTRLSNQQMKNDIFDIIKHMDSGGLIDKVIILETELSAGNKNVEYVFFCCQ